MPSDFNSLPLPLFLCNLAALEMDWANIEGASKRERERMDRNKRGFEAL